MDTAEDRNTLRNVDELLEQYAAGKRHFEGVDLPDGASLRGVTLFGASFSDSLLSDVDFRDTDLRSVCFNRCNLKVSDFEGADLRGASFIDSALCGISLREAKLDDVIVKASHAYGGSISDIRQCI